MHAYLPFVHTYLTTWHTYLTTGLPVYLPTILPTSLRNCFSFLF